MGEFASKPGKRPKSITKSTQVAQERYTRKLNQEVYGLLASGWTGMVSRRTCVAAPVGADFISRVSSLIGQRYTETVKDKTYTYRYTRKQAIIAYLADHYGVSLADAARLLMSAEAYVKSRHPVVVGANKRKQSCQRKKARRIKLIEHNWACTVVKNARYIAIEDSIQRVGQKQEGKSNTAQTRGRRKKVANQRVHTKINEALAPVAEERDSYLFRIPTKPHMPSQHCSSCGHHWGKLELNVREKICPQCGVKHDRDQNAALNNKLTMAKGLTELKYLLEGLQETAVLKEFFETFDGKLPVTKSKTFQTLCKDHKVSPAMALKLSAELKSKVKHYFGGEHKLPKKFFQAVATWEGMC